MLRFMHVCFAVAFLLGRMESVLVLELDGAPRWRFKDGEATRRPTAARRPMWWRCRSWEGLFWSFPEHVIGHMAEVQAQASTCFGLSRDLVRPVSIGHSAQDIQRPWAELVNLE